MTLKAARSGGPRSSAWDVRLILRGRLKQNRAHADDGAVMKRGDHNGRKQRWAAIAARWIEMLWRCPCQYTNVATYRCCGCGSRPPRELRAVVAAAAQAESPS